MYYENRYFFALTDTWFAQHDIVIGSRFTPWVLNDGQFSRGPHWWWNSTINQLLSPCRTVDAGEKVSLNIRNLESWLFIGCRLWMIMILNHSSSGLNPNPLLFTAIAYFNEHILHAVDTGWVTRVAFLDLTKAFDTVNHKIVLGVVDAASDWLTPFLQTEVRSHAAITQCRTKNLSPLRLLRDPSLGRFYSWFTWMIYLMS